MPVRLAGMIRAWACRRFVVNSETGTILTSANVETLKTRPIARILPIVLLSDYLRRLALE
jgi:hypothetical protein